MQRDIINPLSENLWLICNLHKLNKIKPHSPHLRKLVIPKNEAGDVLTWHLSVEPLPLYSPVASPPQREEHEAGGRVHILYVLHIQKHCEIALSFSLSQPVRPGQDMSGNEHETDMTTRLQQAYTAYWETEICIPGQPLGITDREEDLK